MSRSVPYGKGSRTMTKDVLSRDQIIEVMRFLGWHTHEKNGDIADDVFHVAAKMAGKYKECVMLPTWIAAEMNAYRAAHKEGSSS